MNPLQYSLDMRPQQPAYYLSRAPRGKRQKRREGRISVLVFLFCLLFLATLGWVLDTLSAPVAFDTEYATPKKGVSATLATTSK